MVAEEDEQVVGFMIYELHKNRLHILNFAVHPEHRRTGVGKAMLTKLLGKLSHERRNRIMLEVGKAISKHNCFSSRLVFGPFPFCVTSTMTPLKMLT